MTNNAVLLEEDAVLAEQAELEANLDRLEAVRERTGNPEGIEIERLDGMAALYSATMPWPQFNVIKGTHEGILPELERLERFYRERQKPVRLELSPHRASATFLKELGKRGYRLADHHAATFIRFRSSESSEEGHLDRAGDGILASELNSLQSPRCRIRRASVRDIETYARIHCLSTGIGENGIKPVALNNEMLMTRPGWSFWIGETDGVPAAAGVLRCDGELANLTFAATLPEYRSLGFQRLLIRARLEEARNQGCLLAASQCSLYSGSMRNMQREKMRIAFIRSVLVLDT
ncbi:GNAT family N-acetyltransferase [Paenibacillus pasadenensis]|uniref:GNAT family N-acetyltransferase n=1 Tax=Paenibacillus pasadenensis TaxID=217090 RepID=UPI00203E53E4|nr:GNAT family N-acetyltransferase [Paenibacillus pasadenensis]MCM3747171.1 GNAT family N-acetyltransferase [Paenibacillus pasadenensis]